MAENSGEIGTSGTSVMPDEKLPGGAYSPRPIEVNGKKFDPFHSPKLVQNPDGTQGHIGGKEMSRDEVDQMYADRFWRREHQKGLREAMAESIKANALTGTIADFVDESGITEKDKEKLSARRQLAKELGFEVGQFKFKKNTGTATATIKPIAK